MSSHTRATHLKVSSQHPHSSKSSWLKCITCSSEPLDNSPTPPPRNIDLVRYGIDQSKPTAHTQNHLIHPHTLLEKVVFREEDLKMTSSGWNPYPHVESKQNLPAKGIVSEEFQDARHRYGTEAVYNCSAGGQQDHPSSLFASRQESSMQDTPMKPIIQHQHPDFTEQSNNRGKHPEIWTPGRALHETLDRAQETPKRPLESQHEPLRSPQFNTNRHPEILQPGRRPTTYAHDTPVGT